MWVFVVPFGKIFVQVIERRKEVRRRAFIEKTAEGKVDPPLCRQGIPLAVPCAGIDSTEQAFIEPVKYPSIFDFFTCGMPNLEIH